MYRGLSFQRSDFVPLLFYRHHRTNSPLAQIRYRDLGGLDDVIAELYYLVHVPLSQPDLYIQMGGRLPGGVLLHGPPGCGKTALVHAMANECGVPLLHVAAPEVVAGVSGALNGAVGKALNRTG